MREEEKEDRRDESGELGGIEPGPRRRVRLSYGRTAQDSQAPWMWIAVILLVAVAMVASRGCSKSMENLVRVFTQDASPQADAAAPKMAPSGGRIDSGDQNR